MKEEVLHLIQELNKFSPTITEWGGVITDNRVAAFEAAYHVELPADYKSFISLMNGFNLMGTEVYGIDSGRKAPNTLSKIYDIEHWEVQVPMPEYLVPFSPDGGGNYYCFDTRITKKDSCPIVFFHTHFIYLYDAGPEVTHDSFVDWVNDVAIGWTLDEYNYDGSLRED
jgi:hypothetical protein